MKRLLCPAAVALSAVLAACCLLAARCRPSALPAPPAARAGAVLSAAGQALTLLRRKARAAARRTLQTLLLCLAAPLAAWMAGRTAGPMSALPGRAATPAEVRPSCRTAAAPRVFAAGGFAPPDGCGHPARAGPAPPIVVLICAGQPVIML